MRIGSKDFRRQGKTYVMGILNITPDSFSDGGKWNDMDSALFHVEEMLREGMDLLDIGGESTRPGYTLLSEEEEISRV
ncbi:MAG: dihydropteroate synthase, partial [Lachnospiraceae bacterium]|nr:dihydropteroate synthase [Lachnospiraceae bacterium]